MALIPESPKQVIIFEPNFRGHRMNYVKAILEQCATRDTPALIASSEETFSSEEFELRFPRGIEPHQKLSLGPLRDAGEPGYWPWVERSLRNIRKDHPSAQLLVLEGDKLLPLLARSPLGSDRQVRVLVMRVPAISLIGRGAAIGLIKRASRNIIRLRGGKVVGLAPAGIRSNSYSYRGWPCVPDPVDIATDGAKIEEYRRQKDLSDDRTWFGVFGHITRRKNLDLIVGALSSATSTRKIGLLIGGTLDEDVAERSRDAVERLSGRGGRVVVENRLLSDEELDSAMGAVDVAIIANSSVGPSGILAKCAALGTPVIVGGDRELFATLIEIGGQGAFADLDESGLAGASSKFIGEKRKNCLGVTLANSVDFANEMLEPEMAGDR